MLWGEWMDRPEISLSETAIYQINEALSKGKDIEIAVRNNKLIIWETHSKKRYEVVVSQPH